MDCHEIMQGDQYNLPFNICSGGKPLTDEDLSAVEIVIGTLRKTTPEVAYNAETQMWDCPLTQSETLSLTAVPVRAQLRLLFPDGDVVGVKLKPIHILPSASKEVLG